MSALRYPLRDVAPVPVDDATANRLFHGVSARRVARKRDSTRSIALRWLALGAVAGTLLTLCGEWAFWKRGAVDVTAPAALTLANGRPWGAVAAPADRPAVASLADGSEVRLEPGARLEPLENTGHAVSIFLTKGRALFDVQPGGPRRWTIECGLATVEVVGTRFSIDRSPSRLVVTVGRGVVLVRGDRVPDRVQRLTAGEHLEVREEIAVEHPLPSPSAEPARPRVTAAQRAERSDWRVLSTKGDYAAAYQLLGSDGLGAESAESRHVDDLMALADVARLSGHASDAVGPLSRVVAEFPRDPRASLAAFTLGKIHVATPAGAASAACDFANALELGLPASLTEDAYANRVDALRNAGDLATARTTALEYAARFPASARAAGLRAWADAR